MADIKGNVGPQLRWLLDMASFLKTEVIKIPSNYRNQVIETKALLKNDESGIVSTMLDFSISSATDVDYRIETTNPNLTTFLNNWAQDINSSLRGKIPVGIEALAKEYFRERWKGSSNLLLRTVWETVGGFYVPTKLWFVDGEDIICESKTESITLGDERYYIRLAKDKKKALPASKEEIIFVQKPYESWGTCNPVPFIITRGLFKNMAFLRLLLNKGETMTAKALEYLMMLKKGTERLAVEGRPEFTYSKEDLEEVKKNFGDMVADNKGGGIPTYTTNFDTAIEHIIPDYDKILKASLYQPIEKRLLAGLGLISMESIGETRKEATLNPKPFVGEISSGVDDFKALLTDVLVTMVEKNKNKHRKYFGSGKLAEVHNSPIKIFTGDDMRTLMRSMYDRGVISKRTFAETVGDFDYDLEHQRRQEETTAGDDRKMYPPVIQNLDEYSDWDSLPPDMKKDPEAVDNLPDDKKGPEAKNFKSASFGLLEEAKCPHCGEIFDFESQKESGAGKVICPGCDKTVSKKALIEAKVWEMAPYKKLTELPDNIKNVMSKSLQKTWMDAFNSAFPKGEDYARKVAWSVIKKIATKGKDGKWHRKKTTSSLQLEQAHVEAIQEVELGIEAKNRKVDLDDLLKMKKIELIENKEKLLKKLMKEDD